MRGLMIALGVTVAAGVGWSMLRSDAPEEPEAAVASDGTPAAKRRGRVSSRTGGRNDMEPRHDGSLEQRVARLEDEVAMLRRQLAVRGRVAMSGSRVDSPSLDDDPVLDEQVRGIVEDEREQERERSEERRMERFEEIRSEALDELVKVASLSTEQRESIDGLWSTEAERLIPLIGEARSGERSFREVRDEVESLRKETDEAVAAMLTDTQFESYEELRPRGPGRRGGRGGGRGRSPGEPPSSGD